MKYILFVNKKLISSLIQGTLLGIVVGLGILSVIFYLQLQEFTSENIVTTVASHEDDVIKLDNWRIVNIAKSDELSPNQRLAMKLDVHSKWEFDSKLAVKIDISQGGEQIDSYESDYTLGKLDRRLIELPFFLKNEGPQDISISLIFRNDSNNHVFENRARHVYDLEVKSYRDTLLEKQNQTLFGTQLATVAETVRRNFQLI